MPKAPKAPKAPPASPPKRMTRARAKAVEEKQQSQVAAAAGVKAAAGASRTKTKKTDDQPDYSDHRVKVEGAVKKPQAKTQAKKTTKSQSKETNDVAIRDQEDEPASQPSASNRAHSKKQEQRVKPTVTKSATNTRATRGRPEQPKPPQPATKAGTTRKKVTFLDEQEAEKENVIEIRPNSKDGKEVVVKRASSTASQAPQKGRGTSMKSNNHEVSKRSHAGTNGEPLSPKKASQVAKAIPKEKNEEQIPDLSSQSPVRPLLQSPRKQPTPAVIHSPKKLVQEPVEEHPEDYSVDELQLPSIGSPMKQNAGCLTGTPARRPPTPPAKVSLKDSPVKIKLGTPVSKSLTGDRIQAQASSSLAQSPARRPPSPIKLFRDELSSVSQKPPGSMTKTSLLNSPAKRPPSAMKPLYFPTSASKPDLSTAAMSSTGSTLQRSPQKFKMPVSATPSKEPIAPTRSALPTKRPHTSDAEQADALMDELANAPSPFTPRTVKSTEGQAVSQAKRESFKIESQLNPDLSACSTQEMSRSNVQSPTESNLNILPSPEKHQECSTGKASKLDQRKPSLNISAGSLQLRSTIVPGLLEGDSEDELMSDDPKYSVSPSRKSVNATPMHAAALNTDLGVTENSLSMTGLADRFKSWAQATPDPKVLQQRHDEGYIFSPCKPQSVVEPSIVQDSPTNAESVLVQSSNFTEAMEIHEDMCQDESEAHDMQDCQEMFRQSYASEASQEYGDENNVPIDPNLFETIPQMPQTCTPQRLEVNQPQVLHTVSKVPLKPAGEVTVSPGTKAKAVKRLSEASNLTPHSELDLQALRQVYPPAKRSLPLQEDELVFTSYNQGVSQESRVTTPKGRSVSYSGTNTPARTPRADLNKKLLAGAVVFVDVHTSEGADASGIFVDLLQQMGASVRSSWNWNPDKANETDYTESDSRPGITHVVFKDGGKRTMEKVRMAEGVISCVGVGWVLE